MKTTVLTFRKMKRQGEKISMLTCYDYTTARLMDGTVDGILVGDSYGNTMLGYDSTLPVTMEMAARAIWPTKAHSSPERPCKKPTISAISSA